MKRYILDASLLIEAISVARSPASKRMAQLLSEIERCEVEAWAPDFLIQELANFCLQKNYGKDEAIAFLEGVEGLPLNWVHFRLQDVLRTYLLAQEMQVAAYDAAYHLLALENEAALLTCDRRYFTKAEKKGSIELVPV
jgi:predicted nucleic acid-binding protein